MYFALSDARCRAATHSSPGPLEALALAWEQLPSWEQLTRRFTWGPPALTDEGEAVGASLRSQEAAAGGCGERGRDA